MNVHAAASVSVGASSQAGEITLHGADASLSVFGSADRVEIADTAASASVMVATDASVETVAISAAQTELSAHGSIASVDVTKQAAGYAGFRGKRRADRSGIYRGHGYDCQGRG